MTTASVASLRAAPTMAVYGLACVFLYLVPALVFLLPTALVSAELASGWSGGVYRWVAEGLSKPLGFLDVNGFYAPLMQFLDRAVRERFVKEPHRAIALIDADPERLLARFETWRAPKVEKWITREET